MLEETPHITVSLCVSGNLKPDWADPASLSDEAKAPLRGTDGGRGEALETGRNLQRSPPLQNTPHHS